MQKAANSEIFSGVQAISKNPETKLESEPDSGRECAGQTVHGKETMAVANARIYRRLFPEVARIE
jgi:hypothetical protein